MTTFTVCSSKSSCACALVSQTSHCLHTGTAIFTWVDETFVVRFCNKIAVTNFVSLNEMLKKSFYTHYRNILFSRIAGPHIFLLTITVCPCISLSTCTFISTIILFRTLTIVSTWVWAAAFLPNWKVCEVKMNFNALGICISH